MGKSSYQIVWFDGENWVPYPMVSVTGNSVSQVLHVANRMGFWLLCLAVLAMVFVACGGYWSDYVFSWCFLSGGCIGVMIIVWQESVRKMTRLLPPVIEEKKDDQEA